MLRPGSRGHTHRAPDGQRQLLVEIGRRASMMVGAFRLAQAHDLEGFTRTGSCSTVEPLSPKRRADERDPMATQNHGKGLGFGSSPRRAPRQHRRASAGSVQPVRLFEVPQRARPSSLNRALRPANQASLNLLPRSPSRGALHEVGDRGGRDDEVEALHDAALGARRSDTNVRRRSRCPGRHTTGLPSCPTPRGIGLDHGVLFLSAEARYRAVS